MAKGKSKQIAIKKQIMAVKKMNTDRPEHYTVNLGNEKKSEI